ncbi:hypothetical protein DEI78_18505 [Salmonella enterica subsp. enterica serovar Oranienburg]|nr:hypothetical protein [Salmonella enterica subsp. enterica serovar Java]EDV9614996.1 hypothetical protein [Salmonella enterica subsp. enterica serovar Paratyphi B]EDX0151769.1 hypothetical protein [Salmonella enterica]EEM8442465.1 hypothetical protein [Salmonella enterica subsp. enterica serovar Oranienburg]EFV0933802.1 hypothetical protein [Salmonella enterica subsp. enterica serovar 4,[5],12:i:-]EGQ2008882.1 hypothetical protein [Salmonella enterica subsp. enterica serovar Infantis]EHE861
MSDEVKRYPDDDALNKLSGGNDKNTSDRTVAIEPLSALHKPVFIPKQSHDEGKSTDKK